LQQSSKLNLAALFESAHIDFYLSIGGFFYGTFKRMVKHNITTSHPNFILFKKIACLFQKTKLGKQIIFGSLERKEREQGRHETQHYCWAMRFLRVDEQQ
jgi:hypothetical protein